MDKIFVIFITLLLLQLNYSNCQSATSSNSVILNNFYITWTPRENQTDYVIIANFDNITTTNLWFAIGFNYDKPTMVNYYYYLLLKNSIFNLDFSFNLEWI